MSEIIPNLFPDRPVLSVPDGLEVTVREKEGKRYLFLQNFNRKPVDVKVAWDYETCLCGEYPVDEEGTGTVKMFDTVVLRG